MSFPTHKLCMPLGLAVFCFSLSGCDEQTASINEDSALRAALCALSPTALPVLSKLAQDMELQSIANQSVSSCEGGGVIGRTDAGTSVTVIADHCAYTDDTGSNTINGTMTRLEVSESPVTLDWAFESASLTQLISNEEIGQRVTGTVTFQHFESESSVSQIFQFDTLSWDDIEDSLASGIEYGKTEETIQQDKATNATSFEFQSEVEVCGFDTFALDVSTTEPLIQLESEFYPSSGVVEAQAADGSSLSITLNGELLAINLDSNGDEVNDLQLSMSWGELQGSTTVASRQQSQSSTRPTLKLWPFHR